MPRSVVQVIVVVLLGLGGLLHVELRAADRSFTLKEKLATGKSGNRIYTHAHPSFQLSVPPSKQAEWYFVVFDHPTVPFYIVKPISAEATLPFISSAIDRIPPALQPLKPEELFKQVVADAIAWEANVLGVFQVINPGRQFVINGYPAYERTIRNIRQNVFIHMVYLIYQDSLIQLGLNSRQEDFAHDDEGFMNIIGTFSPGIRSKIF